MKKVDEGNKWKWQNLVNDENRRMGNKRLIFWLFILVASVRELSYHKKKCYTKMMSIGEGKICNEKTTREENIAIFFFIFVLDSTYHKKNVREKL